MHGPSDHDNILRWLPDAAYVDPEGFEKKLATEAETTEDLLVVLKASKCVEWVLENYILSGDKIANKFMILTGES